MFVIRSLWQRKLSHVARKVVARPVGVSADSPYQPVIGHLAQPRRRSCWRRRSAHRRNVEVVDILAPERLEVAQHLGHRAGVTPRQDVRHENAVFNSRARAFALRRHLHDTVLVSSSLLSASRFLAIAALTAWAASPSSCTLPLDHTPPGASM